MSFGGYWRNMMYPLMSGIYLNEDQVSGLVVLQPLQGWCMIIPLPRVPPGSILVDAFSVLWTVIICEYLSYVNLHSFNFSLLRQFSTSPFYNVFHPVILLDAFSVLWTVIMCEYLSYVNLYPYHFSRLRQFSTYSFNNVFRPVILLDAFSVLCFDIMGNHTQMEIYTRYASPCNSRCLRQMLPKRSTKACFIRRPLRPYQTYLYPLYWGHV